MSSKVDNGLAVGGSDKDKTPGLYPNTALEDDSTDGSNVG